MPERSFIYPLLAICIPFIGMLIYYLISEFWNDIVRWVKTITSCMCQLLIFIVGAIIVLLISGWLFKSCSIPDADEVNYDYDPGLIHRRH